MISRCPFQPIGFCNFGILYLVFSLGSSRSHLPVAIMLCRAHPWTGCGAFPALATPV